MVIGFLAVVIIIQAIQIDKVNETNLNLMAMKDIQFAVIDSLSAHLERGEEVRNGILFLYEILEIMAEEQP